MSVPCQLYLQERGHADAPGKNKPHKAKPEETGDSTGAFPQKLFLFRLSTISRKRTHAHVYSVDAKRSHPPYRLPTSSDKRKRKEKKIEKEKTQPDSQFNHRGWKPRRREECSPTRDGISSRGSRKAIKDETQNRTETPETQDECRCERVERSRMNQRYT